jgi:hypothetical protein
MICGLYADEAASKFAPAQYVNVYEVPTRAFYCDARMDSLPEEVADDPEGYFLEPTTEGGDVMSLRAALSAGLGAGGALPPAAA